MGKLIAFISGKRIRALFLSDKEPLSLISRYFLILVGVIYGLLFAFMISKNAGHVSADRLLRLATFSVLIFLSFVLIIKNYVPNFRPVNLVISPFYPVSALERAIIHSVTDLFVPTIISLVLFLAIFLPFSGIFSVADTVFIVFWLLTLIYSERSFRLIIDHRILHKGVHFVLIIAEAAGLVLSLWLIWNDNLPGSGLMISEISFFLIVTLGQSVMLEGHIVENAASSKTTRSVKGDRSWFLRLCISLFIRNSKSRTVFFVDIGVKILFAFILYSDTHSGSRPDEFLYFYRFLILAPAMLFSQIFNNTFGYFPTTWLNTQLFSTKPANSRLFYLLLILAPVLADFIFSVVLCWFLGWFTLPMILYYFAVLFVCMPLGYFVSSRHPKLVNKAVPIGRIGGNTNSVYSFGMLLIYIVMALPVYFHLTWIYLITTLGAWIVWRKLPDLETRYRDKVYANVF